MQAVNKITNHYLSWIVFKNTSEIATLLQSVTMDDGVELVRRFVIKVTSISKIWLESVHLAQLSAVIFLTRGAMMPLEESSIQIIELLDLYLGTYNVEEEADKLQASLRNVIQIANSSSYNVFDRQSAL